MTVVAGPRPAWRGKVARLLSACLSKRHSAKAGGARVASGWSWSGRLIWANWRATPGGITAASPKPHGQVPCQDRGVCTIAGAGASS
jgi:hypothetical protein